MANPFSNIRQIPFLNLNRLTELYYEEFMSAIGRVVKNAGFIGGSEVESFEKNFARWVGDGLYASGCGNGTDAITLAALALNLPADSEAVIPAMTFVATAEGLRNAGLRLHLADVSPDTWLLDPDSLERALTPKTRLIAAVHLYGQMAPMDKIREIADRHNCYILEDSAQAHGAKWKGRSIGYWGDIATFSFFPGKNLGGFGDGGAVLSKNQNLVKNCWARGKHGGWAKYQHEFPGFNSRLDAMQAAILNVKLNYIDEWNASRRKVAGLYRAGLTGISELRLPVEKPDAEHVYHLYVVCVPQRESFMQYLKEHGVQTGVHYPLPIHELPAFQKETFAKSHFPNSEFVAHNGVSIPMCPTMQTQDVAYVIETVRSYFGK